LARVPPHKLSLLLETNARTVEGLSTITHKQRALFPLPFTLPFLTLILLISNKQSRQTESTVSDSR
jgi:hypothetical protein